MIQNIDMTLKDSAIEVLKLQKASYMVEADIIGSQNLPPLKETVEDLLISKETYLGFYVEGRIVGVLSYEKNDGVLTICKLMVSPDYFRKGIARQLLAYLMDIENEVVEMKVATGTKNVPAKKLYQDFGFKELQEIEVEDGIILTFFSKKEKLPAEVAAEKFITEFFPDCSGAILSGSVVRGEGTATSDLDIVVFQENLQSAYRETFFSYGWPIEAFVHNFTSYKIFFGSDRERARPSLPRMIAEGKMIKHHPFLHSIQQEAMELLKEGPEPWSEATIKTKRYMLTDVLDDFIGSNKAEEEIWTANALAEQVHEFFLRTNQQWVGHSKWVYRALRSYDPVFADKYYQAFNHYYTTREKYKVIELVDEVLAPFGGRLTEGYSVGKP